MQKLSLKDIEVATNSFAVERLIGKGSHGRVYKGVLADGKFVAVKTASVGLHLVGDDSKLENEIAVLSSLQSPYIVNLLGVSQEAGKRQLVMELMPNGSLEEWLHNSSDPPNWLRRAIIARQIARAVQVLHEAPLQVIHRDIKSANILIDLQWNARLADFGLAVRVHHGLMSTQKIDNKDHINTNAPDTIKTAPAGTIGYLDPCYTTPGRLSTKIDVFSFGVVLLEMLSGRRAMDIGLEPASIVEWALPLIEQDRVAEIYDPRVPLPSNMKSAVRCILRIATKCISYKHERRPSMREIVTELVTELEHRHVSIWSLLKGALSRRSHENLKAKRKRTTTIICKGTRKGEDVLVRGGVHVMEGM